MRHLIRKRGHLIAALAVVVTALSSAAATVIASGSSAASTFACAGVPADAPATSYAQPRVFLESQSWTEPQPVRAGYAGSGLQGHIHVGMCWPLFQHVAGVVPLDILIQSHNRTQPINYGIRGDQYPWANEIGPTPLDVSNHSSFQNAGGIDCHDAQCQQWYHWDYDVSGLPRSGLSSFYFFPISNWVTGEPGAQDWPYGTWFAYVDNGAPPADLTQEDSPDWIGGEAEYRAPEGKADVGAYARVFIATADYPFDKTTGQLVPVSGQWTLRLGCECATETVLVDPKLHAAPIDYGLVVQKDAAPAGQVTVDTTKLAAGLHYLLVAGKRTHPDGISWTAVLKVPFCVQSCSAAAPTPPPSSTTTTTPMPVVPVNLHVTSQTCTGVSVAWDAVPGASSYSVGRRMNGGAWTTYVTPYPRLNSGWSVNGSYDFQAAARGGPSSTLSGVVRAC